MPMPIFYFAVIFMPGLQRMAERVAAATTRLIYSKSASFPLKCPPRMHSNTLHPQYAAITFAGGNWGFLSTFGEEMGKLFECQSALLEPGVKPSSLSIRGWENIASAAVFSTQTGKFRGRKMGNLSHVPQPPGYSRWIP